MQVYTKDLKEFVTTVEQSKQLMELGIDYETKFVWYYQTAQDDYSIRRRDQVTKFFDNEIYPAYLPNELWVVYEDLDPMIRRSDLTNDLFIYILQQKSAESGINTKQNMENVL